MMKPAKYLLTGALALLTSVWTLDASAQEEKKPKDPPVTSQDNKDKEKPKEPVTSDKKDSLENDPLVIEAKELFSKGDFAKCQKSLEDAVKKNPLLPPAKLMLARMLLATQNQQTVQAGRQMLEFAIAENPQHPEVYLTNGSLALAEGRVTDTLFNCALAMSLAEHERWSGAQRRTFLKEARAGLATGFEARKDWASAKPHLNAWLDLDPNNNQIRQRLAKALFLNGKNTDREEALGLLEKAYEKDGEPPLVQLGMLAVQLVGQEITTGDNKQPDNYYEKMADEYFNRAMKDYATDTTKLVKVYQALAGWKLDKRELTAAQGEISKALEIEKGNPSRATRALIGLKARYEKDYETAEKEFGAIVALYPGDFFAQNQLALVLCEQSKDEDKMKRAVAMADANARQNSRSAEAYATLAWTLYKSKRYEEARKAIGLATSNGQASPDTAYFLARILVEQEKPNYEDAFDNLDKALKSKGVFVNLEAAKAFKDEIAEKAAKQKAERKAAEKAPAK